MHSALFVSVTYLGLTCCSNGSDAPAAPSPSCSCSKLLLLADLKSSPVPPSQTLGVLFFPLSPPSRKGATHNQKVLAPQLASKAELPLTYAEDSQLLPVNQSVSPLLHSPPISAKEKKSPFFSFLPSLYPLKTLIPFHLGFPFF
jgi:hypothetical protein